MVKNNLERFVKAQAGVYETALLQKELKDALMDNITKFLLELGKGFAFVGREYRLTVGKTEQFIDLLFYNREARYRFADRYWSLGDRDTSEVGHFICYLTDKMCYTKNDDNSFSEIKSTEEYTPVLTTRGYVINIKEHKPKVIAIKANTYLQVAQLNDMYFYRGGKGKKELWCFNSGQATLVAEDVKQVWQKNDKLEILTTAGKARIISLGK